MMLTMMVIPLIMIKVMLLMMIRITSTWNEDEDVKIDDEAVDDSNQHDDDGSDLHEAVDY